MCPNCTTTYFLTLKGHYELLNIFAYILMIPGVLISIILPNNLV